jgi:mRNA-degrading endonuclease RelE of RelBE toxin-antitoxin system
MHYVNHPSFDKDFKKLLKRFRTLESDFQTLKTYAIDPLHLSGAAIPGILPIKGLCGETYNSYKIRKFACRELKGSGSNSGLRVIYVHHTDTQTITFIEIYFKGDQENEDRARLQAFIDVNC